MEKIYSRFVSKQVLFLLLSFICAGQLWATDVSGDVSGTWTKANSPYKLTGAVTVKAGTTLTIEPGVIVQFPSQYNSGSDPYIGLSMTVSGTLIAKGTADSYIIFQGDAYGIDHGYFNRVNSGPIIIGSGSNSVLQYVTIDALGFGTTFRNDNTAALDIFSSTASVTNCKIKNVRGTGVLFETANTKAIVNNELDSNTVGLKFRNSSPLVDSNLFSANSRLDIITCFDNLYKVQNNNYSGTGILSAGIGITADIAVSRTYDTLANIASQYVLLEPVIVPPGRNLIMLPGIVFQFPSQYNSGSDPNAGLTLDIEGNLIAKGTADSYISLKGDAYGIDHGYFNRVNSGPLIIGNTSNSILQYVTIDALGFGTTFRNDNTAAINISSSTSSITNCNIQNIRGTGILFANFSSKPVANNTFTSNTVGLKVRNFSPLVDSNTFSTNTYLDVITGLDNLYKLQNNNYLGNGVLDAGIGLTADIPIGRNDTMRNITSQYVLLEPITVPSTKILTMDPGIVFQFPAQYNSTSDPNNGLTLTIGGTLLAKGTADSYISLKGDGYGIDHGYFNRVNSGPIFLLSSSINSVLQYVNVSELGFGTTFRNDSTAAINVNSSSCNILNCNFQDIRGEALTIRGASPYIAGTCFNKNRGGIFSRGGNTKVLHSNFTGNTSFGVKNISAANIVDATECWWNSPAGPTTANQVGGDIVSDYVLYDPWATDQPYECSDPSILPLTLLNFQATLANNTVNCSWQTATETNTSYFIVQRSTDGIGFTNLSKVYASGNSAATRSYSFADKSPNNGINYYRLQMVDKDGRYTYSKTVPINIAIKQPFAIYPNPVKDVLYVQVQRSAAEKVSLQIVDMQGNIVLQQSHQLSAGVTSLSANTTALAKGTYFAVIKGQTTEKKIFIKE